MSTIPRTISKQREHFATVFEPQPDDEFFWTQEEDELFAQFIYAEGDPDDEFKLDHEEVMGGTLHDYMRKREQANPKLFINMTARTHRPSWKAWVGKYK